MGFGVGSAIDLGLVIEAKDMASSVLEGIGKTLESVITTTANFQTALNQAQNNTTMTTADAEKMRQTVLALNSQSGAPLDQLVQGFRLIYSTGFDAADSTTLLNEAMMSAVSTGANVTDVAGTLSLQMHDFGLAASQAGGAMNVLHLASALSRVDMQDFASETSKATAMAAVLGIPMTQVDAALAALTLHLGSAAQASTALFGEFSKMVAPTTAAGKELAALSEQSGINLVQDFSEAGIQAKGFTGVMSDLQAATGGNTAEVLRLIPALRGGLAAMVLQSTGTQDYTKNVLLLNDAMAGKIDPTTAAYQRTLDTFNGSLAIAQADLGQFFITIGQPILDTLTPYLHGLIDWMNGHKADISAFGKAIGTDVGDAVSQLARIITTHQTEIDAFVTKMSVDLVQGVQALTTDIPLLVAQFSQWGTAIQSFGKQVDPVVTTVGNLLGFLLQLNALDFQLQLKGAQILGGAAGAVGSTVGGAFSGLGSAANAANNFLFPPGVGPLGQAPQFGPPIPAGYGLVEPGRFGAGNIYGQEMILPGLPRSDTLQGYGGAARGGAGGAPTFPTGKSGDPVHVTTVPAVPVYLTAAQLQALLDQARAQFAQDLVTNATQTTLFGDIATVVKDMRATGITGAQLQYDATTMNNQAYQNLINRATDQFTLDKDNSAAQTVLMGDINTVLGLMKQQGDTANAIAIKRHDLLAEINKTTAATAAGTTPFSPFSSYRLPQEAGFGQAIISFASVTAASAQQRLRQLETEVTLDRQIIANLTAQLAAKEQQTGIQQQAVQHAAKTATATTRLADAANKPATSLHQALRSGGVQLAAR